MSKLYIMVTKDEYEYTLASADSQKELAMQLGVNPSVICRGIKRDKRGGRSKYREIEVEDEGHDI